MAKLHTDLKNINSLEMILSAHSKIEVRNEQNIQTFIE